MTRILALSDIHNLLRPVRELRAMEENRYDAIVVAGDFGSQAAGEICSILATFCCPVTYVLGNWDYGVPVEHDYGPSTHHLHLQPHQVGDHHFVGLSFPMGDGTQRSKHDDERAALAETVHSVGAAKTVVVSHERLPRTSADLFDVPLFLFGHHHGFLDRTHKGARFVNVSALGVLVSLRPIGSKSDRDIRNSYVGSYVVAELQGRSCSIESKSLANHVPGGWEIIPKAIYGSAPFLDDAIANPSPGVRK